MEAPTDASPLDPSIGGADPTTGVSNLGAITVSAPREKPPGYEDAVHARRMNLEAEYDDTRHKQDDTFKQLQGAEDDLADTQAQQDKALQDWYQNNYPKGDVAPPEYKPVTMDDVRGNLIPLLIGATIAGAGSRRHYMGAMSAFGSMLKGADEGRKEQFEAAKTNFDGQMKVLEEKQKAFTQQFNAIVANNKATIAAKEHAIKMLEMQYGKNIQDGSDLNRAIDRTYAEDQNFQNMLSRNKNFSAKLAADVVKKTKDNATALTPSALRAEAAVALSKGGQIPNFGARGGDTQRQVANEMAKMMGEFGITPEQLAGMGADFKANSTSLATQTKAYDAMSGYMTSFHNNIKTWQEVAAGTDPSIIQKASGTLKNELAKLDIHGDINDSTNMTAWNNAMLSVKKQLGDPQAVAYVTATMAVAMDYSRIMAGGATGSVAQTAEGAREDAINLIDKGLSPEARQAQIEILEADTQGQLAGKELQIQRIKDRMKLIATATKTGTIQPSAEHAAQGFGPITVKPAPPQ